jgi:hypothetical protein
MNKAKGLREVNNTNVEDELNFVVDQIKEITLRIGGRKCVMTTQIIELQKENDALAK